MRPLSWLEERGITQVGSWTALSMPEMGAEGEFQVVEIGPCPEIEDGPGRVVTGEFRHSRGMVYDLWIEGEPKPIGVTAGHPFWSVDRKTWVPLEKLRVGERVQCSGHTAPVLKIEERGVEPVFNLEVDTDHCYRVGNQGILVHNNSVPGATNPVACSPCAYTKRIGTTVVGGGGTFIVEYALGTDSAGNPLTYKSAGLKSRGDGADTQLVCRVYSLSGKVKANASTMRNGTPQELWGRLMQGLSVTGQEAGHLLGLQFGGPDDVKAIVPMNETLNVGAWKAMENQIAKCLSGGGSSGGSCGGPDSAPAESQYNVSVSYGADRIVPTLFNVVMRFSAPDRTGERNVLYFANTSLEALTQ